MTTQDSVPGKGASQIVADARTTTPEITVGQARKELDQGHVSLLLDVREPAEWEKAHIPGAVLAPRGMLEWYADPTTPYAKPEITTKRDAYIIVACASGGRSMLAAQTLQSMGYTHVVSMAGGFNEWSKQGFPIEGIQER
ncbi:rhodanese-like domain-containing protein [Dictyobacter alpinus]|uniref:Rhodanese-like domain-containing protein n=1 Tax=Dictyobacter alpinus TaxID=2014873 RepID=A0A402BEE4_9CHLR|nr:rhodanese-like domain-containing protein [Dictyobacter alpinus]GCE29768.1 rhodanese-like domain-containing protein [Dictyobacter alpinus]